MSKKKLRNKLKQGEIIKNNIIYFTNNYLKFYMMKKTCFRKYKLDVEEEN